jgi:hypothetical protein
MSGMKEESTYLISREQTFLATNATIPEDLGKDLNITGLKSD